ncbi:hypothetical protein B0J13DRAFT_24104 [Dactylonectria estremocensis]|uniref:Uncharacterized protein n=1 Tax=Dactylonectria estremocensis TaxID=1079267 RepID=A0A9P9FJQ1_9HYPO|nr:hypothetical protein B0J13DRAFT_24104 [Dactylonectria estremocensis]
MCHTIIAKRMCQVCHRSQGEKVIDFERCARKCSSPFYCLTPTPEMEVCALCAWKPCTPNLAQHAAEDSTTAAAVMAVRPPVLRLSVDEGGDGSTPGGGPPRLSVPPGLTPGRQPVFG